MSQNKSQIHKPCQPSRPLPCATCVYAEHPLRHYFGKSCQAIHTTTQTLSQLRKHRSQAHFFGCLHEQTQTNSQHFTQALCHNCQQVLPRFHFQNFEHDLPRTHCSKPNVRRLSSKKKLLRLKCHNLDLPEGHLRIATYTLRLHVHNIENVRNCNVESPAYADTNELYQSIVFCRSARKQAPIPPEVKSGSKPSQYLNAYLRALPLAHLQQWVFSNQHKTVPPDMSRAKLQTNNHMMETQET